MARQRMSDADRERYGGPEWLDFQEALRWVDDLSYEKLVDLEGQIRAELTGKVGIPAAEISLLWAFDEILTVSPVAKSLPMLRVRLWLALLAAGVDIPLAGFTPHIFATAWEPTPKAEEETTDPPAGTPDSSDTSTSTPADTPPSPSSTDASAPGPGASTA